MPYVEGESLRRRLNRERQLPVDEAIRLAAAIADALDYAHQTSAIAYALTTAAPIRRA